MKKKIVILCSTGSIGKCLLNIIDKDQKSFEVVLLSAHKNFKELFKQAKQFKGIDFLERRLLKAQKRVLKDEVERLVYLHEQLFPNDSLQERTLNFTTFYIDLGKDFLPELIDALDPLNPDFVLLEY